MAMERSLTAFSFALFASLASAIVLAVQAQQIPGFISIDCGAPNEYTDNDTNIFYETDDRFTDSGENMQISTEFIYENYGQYLKTLRIFPDGRRNCYTLGPDRGKNRTYLIRATFWYGNYDGKNQSPSFDLYIDVNYWTKVSSPDAHYKEIMYVAPADDIQVCLVNTSQGVPFISALELRALDDDGIYRQGSRFLRRVWREDIGRNLENEVRYPDDYYDRIWEATEYHPWITLNTSSAIDLSDNIDAFKYKVPEKVLQTAQRSENASSPMNFSWTPSSTAEKWIVYFYFVEIERLTSGQQRKFTISMNEYQFTETVSLEYLKPVVVVSTPVYGSRISFSIESTNKSGNPPILNALEYYTVSDLTDIPTAQDYDFISIDCGAPNEFTDNDTNIIYQTDDKFTDSGENKQVSSEVMYTDDRLNSRTLRIFPDGTRNCYTLGPDQGKNKTYLIRATFWYGNYDEKNRTPSFDIYIDVNYWVTVNYSYHSYEEIMYVAPADDIQVCLMNTGQGVPFISALDLRALDDDGIYRLGSGFLQLDWRLDIGRSLEDVVRYPDDSYDRIWAPTEYDSWITLNTTSAINLSDNNDAFKYEIPRKVLQTAQRSENASSPMILKWTPSSSTGKWIAYFYFVEIERLTSGQQRKFTISMNEYQFTETVSLEYLKPVVVVSTPVHGWLISVSIESTYKSGNPPILNAMELYTISDLTDVPTAEDDVKAINMIKETYHIIRESWQGDPCVPDNYKWDGLNCSHENPPRIISVKLSSINLTGEIVSSFSHLSAMEYLDLSDNQLTGAIPKILADLPHLRFLNLSGNNLTGSVPEALKKRVKDSTLNMSLTGNINLCRAYPCLQKKKQRNFLVPVVTSISGFFVVSFGALAIVWLIKWKRIAESSNRTLRLKGRAFKYGEVSRITGNFGRVIGEGGFGKVYLGTLDCGTLVAVKMLSESSKQGYKEFQTEVQLLMILHHGNLVPLLGYCNDSRHMALVYVYMANGNLRQHLSGKVKMQPTEDHLKVLTWSKRLQIAVDAAQGLDYLHNGCKPSIIHRDLKTANILLNDDFRAKISDFGLSRAFASENDTHVSTCPAGTPGYLDPEFHCTGNLNKKSDVYSFGIILIELITGQPAIMRSEDGSTSMHILQWLFPIVESGDIQSIMDPRLQGRFDINSAGKVVDIAMSCTRPKAIQRPDINQVLAELKESLVSEPSGSPQMTSLNLLSYTAPYGR